MKKLLSFTVALFLLFFSATTSFAATKTDLSTIPLDKLSGAAKTILRITLNVAVAQARKGEPVTGSSGELGIQFADYSLQELEVLQARLSDDTSGNAQTDTKLQSLVCDVKRSAEKHFNSKEPVEVNLYGNNLLIEVVGKDSLTTKLLKSGMLLAVYDVMSENRNPPVDFDFLISFPLVDKYGNAENTIVMKVTFKSESMAKINWDRFLHIDIQNAADHYWEHPAFSE